MRMLEISDKAIPFDAFTNMGNLLFKLIGMRPFQTETYIWWDIIFIAGITNLGFIFAAECGFVYMAMKNRQHFVEATLSLAFLSFVCVSYAKVFSIYNKKPQIIKLVRELHMLYPKTTQQQRTFKVAHYLRRHKVVTKPYVMLYMLILVFYFLYWLGLFYVNYYVYGDKTTKHVLPLNVWVPWEYSDNWTFYPLYTSQFLATFTCFQGQLGTDVLLCMFVLQITMHYEYLGQHIREYVADSTVKAGCQDMAFIGRVVEYHQKLLYLSNVVNEIFGVLMLWNFTFSSLNICFSTFSTMTLNTVPMPIAITLYLYTICALVQVSIFGSSSQELMEASENVGASIYNHDWHKADVHYKKVLVVIIQRSQKPVMLKATNFLPISLATVTEVVQISYKVFAVLKTIYFD